MIGLYEALLAFALITSPPGSPLPPDEICEFIRPSINKIAKILDVDGYGENLDILRQRYVNIQTFPPLADIALFGFSREHCIDARYIAGTSWTRVTTLYHMGLVNERAATLMDQKRDVYNAWDYLAEAQILSAPNYNRRYWLNSLRELIGDENYYNGHMPLPLP